MRNYRRIITLGWLVSAFLAVPYVLVKLASLLIVVRSTITFWEERSKPIEMREGGANDKKAVIPQPNAFPE